MIDIDADLECDAVATPKPIDEVAEQLGLSRRTLQRLIDKLGLTIYKVPGGGKRIYLDPDEVRRKRRPRPEPSN